MFVVDTNVFLYAVNQDVEEHPSASEAVAAWLEGSEDWYVTWSILYEFLRVSTHRGVFPRPLTFTQAWKYLEGLLASPRFSVLVESDRHPSVLRDLREEYPDLAGNVMHDLHTVSLMKEHGVSEIRTRDHVFERFPFLRVVDPFTMESMPENDAEQ